MLVAPARPDVAAKANESRLAVWGKSLRGHPLVGPGLALLLLVIVFSFASDRFLTATNVSLVLQQTLVLGMLALGQTLIILTAGVDLALGAITVLATILAAKLAVGGAPEELALLLAVALAIAASTLNGWLVAKVRLPPFIVTLGAFTVLTAVSYLLSGSRSQTIPKGFLTLLGQGVSLGGVFVSWGIPTLLAAYALFAHILGKTAWGKHIYAVGDNPDAARVAGVRVERTLIGVYVVAGLLYGVGAWLSLGRIPSADPNAMANIALQSITAVVLGGTSFFGGRGKVLGTLIGALIVGVLRNGLTLAGIDSLFQDIITGILIVATVSLDQYSRRRSA